MAKAKKKKKEKKLGVSAEQYILHRVQHCTRKVEFYIYGTAYLT